MNWKHYPKEKPQTIYGEYLCKGISEITKTKHFWVCTWVDQLGLRGFFYNGNSFDCQCEGQEFDWISVDELE